MHWFNVGGLRNTAKIDRIKIKVANDVENLFGLINFTKYSVTAMNINKANVVIIKDKGTITCKNSVASFKLVVSKSVAKSASNGAFIS